MKRGLKNIRELLDWLVERSDELELVIINHDSREVKLTCRRIKILKRGGLCQIYHS